MCEVRLNLHFEVYIDISILTFQRPTLCASPLKGNEEPANINPFTPAPPQMRLRLAQVTHHHVLQRHSSMKQKLNIRSIRKKSHPRARESSQSDLSDCPFEGGDSSQEKQPRTKKVRVSDMNVTRYQVIPAAFLLRVDIKS